MTTRRGASVKRAIPAGGTSRIVHTPEEELFLELQRTSQLCVRRVVEVLKPFGLSPAQFNVLRILRGARPEALSASRICERMIHHDPDLTRLLDRLEAAGLAAKARDHRDRRVMNVTITDEGLRLVQAATDEIRTRFAHGMAHVPKSRLGALAGELRALREGLERG